MSSNKILILDAGAQYGKLIDRRIRELCVDTLLLPLNAAFTTIKSHIDSSVKGVIISGSPHSVNLPDSPICDSKLFSDLQLPILGICYGLQIINKHFGGSVSSKSFREDGQFVVELLSSPLFEDISGKSGIKALLTHGDSIEDLSPEFDVIANSRLFIAGIQHSSKPIYAVQFHPESDLTEFGVELFRNFLFKICNCSPSYTVQDREASCIREIKEIVGDKTVLMMLSGGVDSTVCAALLSRALKPSQILTLHINNGFLRHNESSKVVDSLKVLGIDVIYVDASIYFSTATISSPSHMNLQNKHVPVLGLPLCRVKDPEEKRKIIGDTFVRIANRVILSLNLNPDNVILGQGTLRPDLIESASIIASKSASTIKTHHNDSNMVRELRLMGRVIEPLKDFHKDEVRVLGRILKLPESIVQKHPFPGPGLAIRVLCASEPFVDENSEETLYLLKVISKFHQYQKSDSMPLRFRSIPEDVRTALCSATEACDISCHLLPIRSVGVRGDARSYSLVSVLSSSCEEPPWNRLLSLSTIIPSIIPTISRVCFLFGAPPVCLSVTSTLLSPPVIDLLRGVDNVVNEAFSSCSSKISQFPVILIPIHFDTQFAFQRSVVLRPFISSDFMTGKPAIPDIHYPAQVLKDCLSKLSLINGISRICYDLTTKPPGTTEWE